MSGAMVTTTNGMVWNGTGWVTSTTAAAPAPPAQEPPQQLVHKYTQIYHEWIARKQEFEKRVSQLPVMSKERADAQQHVDWSQQYADAASRAAHHYHNTPHLPVAFALPEAPSPMVAPVASAPVAVQQQKPAAAASSEGSLKRYVHRCLQPCATPEQKAAGQKIVEQVIAKALQNGTLHSTNWDAVGLPAEINNIVGATARPPPPPPPRKKQKVDATTVIATSSKNNSNNYSSSSYYYNGVGTGASPYGPASSFPQQQQNPYQAPFSQNAGGGGYYGPSGTTPAATNTNSFSPSQQQQPPVNYGKYGPSTSSSATPDTLDYNNGSLIAFGKNNNKYVNPNSKKNKKKPGMDGVGFQKSSQTLAQRANRFSGPGGNHDVRSSTARGIDDRYMGKGVIGGNGALDEYDYEHMKIKGTCQTLEKQYLRLTAPPKPELVRPLPILQKHLNNLKAEWALGEKESNGNNNNNNNIIIQGKKRRDYLWFCAEMKALRQDLTVQHIRNAFTCEVYETHARMALQEGDLNEFNQAQTQLEILYDLFRKEKGRSDGTNNKKSKVEVTGLENENEFVAYRLIYFVMLTLNPKYTGGSSDMLRLMLSLTASQQRDDAAIQHALQVRAAVADMDYHKFFLLNKRCPNLGGKLTNLMVPTIRHQALQRICKAYRPLAEVKYVLQEIGLMSDTKNSAKALEDGKTFLLSCGCILSGNGLEINTKESIVRESDLQAKQSLI